MNRDTPEFWEALNALPASVQSSARRRFALFADNPHHPSLHFKKVGRHWSVRVSRDYRATAIQNGDDYLWLWIGRHDEYERRIR